MVHYLYILAISVPISNVESNDLFILYLLKVHKFFRLFLRFFPVSSCKGHRLFKSEYSCFGSFSRESIFAGWSEKIK